VRIALDTSVLVAGLMQSHPHFATASPWLEALDGGQIEGFWTTHAYAESWAVLTRMPTADRILGADALRVLESLVAIVPPTPLGFTEYRAAAQRASDAGGRSGLVFDALHLVAAEADGADAFLTYNVTDFQRLKPAIVVAAPQADVADFRIRHGFE